MIAEPSAEVFREMIEASEIEFKGIDYDAVSKFLGEHLSTDEIKNEGMEEIVYIKVEKETKKRKKKASQNIPKRDMNDVTSANDDGHEKHAHKTVYKEKVKRKALNINKTDGSSTINVKSMGTSSKKVTENVSGDVTHAYDDEYEEKKLLTKL